MHACKVHVLANGHQFFQREPAPVAMCRQCLQTCCKRRINLLFSTRSSHATVARSRRSWATSFLLSSRWYSLRRFSALILSSCALVMPRRIIVATKLNWKVNQSTRNILQQLARQSYWNLSTYLKWSWNVSGQELCIHVGSKVHARHNFRITD